MQNITSTLGTHKLFSPAFIKQVGPAVALFFIQERFAFSVPGLCCCRALKEGIGEKTVMRQRDDGREGYTGNGSWGAGAGEWIRERNKDV